MLGKDTIAWERRHKSLRRALGGEYRQRRIGNEDELAGTPYGERRRTG